MKSALYQSFSKRFAVLFSAFFALTFLGTNVASAYQYPSKPPHRQFRIFIPAAATAKKVLSGTQNTNATKTSTTSSKSLMMQASAKSLVAQPTARNSASVYSGPKIDVYVQATANPNATYFGDGITPVIGCTNSQPQYVAGTPIATLYNSDGVTLASPITVTTPANTVYIVKCSLKPDPSSPINSSIGPEYVNLYFVDTQFTILPRPLTITPSDQNTFVGETPAVNVNVSGLVNGNTIAPETVIYQTLSNPVSTIDPVTAGSGNYNIVPSSVSFTNGIASNYSIIYQNGLLTINPLTNILITPTLNKSSSTYGDLISISPSFTSSLASKLTQDPVCSTYADSTHLQPVTISASTPVGSYFAFCKDAIPSRGYTVSYASDAILTITPRPLLVTAQDQSIFVDGTPVVSVTITGLANSDSVSPETVSYESNANPPVSINPATAGSGTYRIVPSALTFTQGTSANYLINYVNGVLTISPLTDIVISPSTSLSTSTFGSSTAPTISFTSLNANQLSSNPTCALYTDAAHTHLAAISQTTDAGTYYAFCKDAVAKPGYTVTYTRDAIFTINPLAITVKAQSPAAITEGSALPVNTYELLPSLIGSDAVSSLNYSYSREGASTPVLTPQSPGAYWINPDQVALSPGKTSNYLFSYQHGTLTINPVPPVICTTNCRPPSPQPPVVIPVAPTPTPTPTPVLTQVAKPIVVTPTTAKPKTKIVAKKRFSKTAMQSDRVANFAKISNVTGKTNLIKLPHDAGTKVTLTDGVATSLKDRLKLETTSEGLNITAVNGWTGRISVPAVVTQNGEQVELFVAVVEVPAPVLFPKFYLDDLLSATIKWQPDGSQVVFYNVYLGNQLLCTTPSTMCTQVGQLNTKADLHIEAVGHQSTFSTQVPPVYTSTALIPATVVHFDTASAKLGSYEQSLLDDLVLAAKNMGLNTIYITGHTDSTGNPALNIPLSKARSTAVKKYIEKFFPKVTIIWRGFAANNPVATNSTTSGRENNRRAEVSVG